MKIESILLKLYPREWRERYEEEFRALLEQNRGSLVDLADMAWGALDAHMRPQVTEASVKPERRLFMNRATFVKWSGMAAILGSVLVVLALIGSLLFVDNDYPYSYGVEDTVFSSLLLAGAILLLAGTVGFWLAYARQSGGLGQAGLLVALIGLVSFSAGAVGSVMEKIGSNLPAWWEMLMFGLLGLFVGMALFAVAGVRSRTLTSFQCIPLFGGGVLGALAFLVTLGFFREQSGGTLEMVLGIVFFSVIVVVLAGMSLVGVDVWSGRERSAPQVESAAA